MSRIIWNKGNPIVIFNQHVLEAKKVLRKLSKEELFEYGKKIGIPNYETLRRGSLLRECLALVANNFKKDWKAKYGWDLDDARDHKKLAARIGEIKIKKRQAMNTSMLDAMKPFVDKEPSKELANELREAAVEVAEKFGSTNIPDSDKLYQLVYEAREKIEQEAKDNKEVPAENITWQKAKALLGDEGYKAAKESGEGITEDEERLTYVGKKWYLHA